MKDETSLIAAARACGIETEFIDAAGVRKVASVETLRAFVDLLRDDAQGSSAPLEPVLVAWNGGPLRVRLQPDPEIRCAEIILEDGSARVAPVRNRVLALSNLPLGYHHLRFTTGAGEFESLVISAPTRAFGERGRRGVGAFVPMYALRSESNWGAGNLTDCRVLCESIADAAGPASSRRAGSRTVVASTLPLLGAFLDDWMCEPSPYSPATRLFWNEFFLDVTGVPEFHASRAAQRLVNSSAFQRELAELREDSAVDYRGGMKFRQRVLEKLSGEFFAGASARRSVFEDFLKTRPELQRYAAFRATCDQRRAAWQTWPAQMRSGVLRTGDIHRIRSRYHAFVQWLMQEQMDATLARCRERGARLYLDLPLGVNPASYDTWAHQDVFMLKASVGAPPDTFFTKGQDWGFPPLHPERIRRTGYRYVIDYLRFQMRHAGMLRLDHVMGLHRLWWVPPGANASEGAYVRYRAEEFYAILCLESHRHRAILVGENLGTVPPEVNRSMKRHGVRGMYVVQYELRPNAKQPLRDPPRNCAASLNTHDMPTWAAYRRGLDIADRQQLGLLTATEASAERRSRREVNNALESFLRRKGLLHDRARERDVLRAILQFLANSPAELMLVNLEDLNLETQPQNTPGTSTERVNWRRKMRATGKFDAGKRFSLFGDLVRIRE